MSSEDAFNEYQSPMAAEPVAAPPGQVSIWFKLIAVFCMVMGGIGLLRGLKGIADATLATQAMGNMAGMPANTPQEKELKKTMEDYQEQILTLNRQFMPFNLTVALFQLVVSAVLLTGGIMGISRSRKARTFMLWGCLAAILFEFCRSPLRMIQMLQMAPIQAEMMEKMQEIGSGGGQQPPMDLSQLTSIGFNIIVVIMALFAMFKLFLYIATSVYLARQPASPAESPAS